MHEHIKRLRPGSARARSLLDPNAGRPANSRPRQEEEGTNGKQPRSAEAAHVSAHAIIIEPERLQRHTTDVLRGVLPPINSTGVGALGPASWRSPASSPRGPDSPELSRMSALSMAESSALSDLSASARSDASFHPARMWLPTKSRPSTRAGGYSSQQLGSPLNPRLSR